MREAFRQKANAESLQGALEKLPEEFREMIVLHDLEGLTYKEIAARRGDSHRHGDVAARAGAGTVARGNRRLEPEGIIAMNHDEASRLMGAYLDGELDLTTCWPWKSTSRAARPAGNRWKANRR